MNKPAERGSRDTGSDQPSGGPADRPAGAIKGDESVPQYGEPGEADFETGFTTSPPRDVEPAVPPYEGRTTGTDTDKSPRETGARTAGATRPVTDPDFKPPAPEDTPEGATASPAQEQPAAQTTERDLADDRVGPSHTPGTGRGEDKR